MNCAHCDAVSYLVPICTKAAKPNACVLAWDRGAWTADGKKQTDACLRWEKR